MAKSKRKSSTTSINTNKNEIIKDSSYYINLLNKDFGMKSDLFICLIFSLFPLIINDYTNVTSVKYTTFLCMSLLLIGAVLFSFGGMCLDGFRFKIRFKKSFLLSPDFFLLLFLLFNFISVIFSPYKNLKNFDGQSSLLYGSGRYDGLYTLLLYIAVYFIISNFGDFKVKHIIIIAVTAFIMCSISLIQLSGVNLLDFYPNFKGGVISFISTVGNIDIFSGLFCIFVPILVTSYIMLDNTIVVNSIILISQVFSIYCLFETGVSSGRIALIFTLIVLTPFVFDKVNKTIRLLFVFSALSIALFLYRILEFDYSYYYRKTFFKIVFDTVSQILIVFSILFILVGFLLKFIAKRNLFKTLFIKLIAAVLILFFAVFTFAYTFSYLPIKSTVVYNPTQPKVQSSQQNNNQSSSQQKNQQTSSQKENPQKQTVNQDLQGGQGLAQEFSDFLQGNINESSGSYRIAIWKNSILMGMKNPIFGTGIGTFLETFENFIEGSELDEILELTDVAHNEYVHLFCTVGLTGLISYLGFLLSLAIKSFKNIRKNPYILILGSAVLCFSAQAFFSFNVVIITPFFWVCAALLHKKIKETYS